MKMFSWQLPDWPAFTFARSALRDELAEFARAFRAAEKALRQPQDPLVVAQTLTAEAVTTSAIEGVEVDAAIVMSSICRALGVSGVPLTAARDPASEGAARMVLSVREDWNAPLSAALLRKWHGTLLAGDARGIRAVRALVAAGRIEHRGSRKTGGYFATQSDATMHNEECTMHNAQ